jgi:two-component system alkaline phosphatase synthesis response regulator PhoP
VGQDAEAGARAPTRVLVVDDERPIRLLCRVNLALAGMDMLEAADGEEGLEHARTGAPDLVLLDLMMPRVDGWTVAQELQADERTRAVPIVFLTARATAVDQRRAEDLGALRYILKPFDPVGLAAVLAEVVGRCERGEAEALRAERPTALWPLELEGR